MTKHRNMLSKIHHSLSTHLRNCACALLAQWEWEWLAWRAEGNLPRAIRTQNAAVPCSDIEKDGFTGSYLSALSPCERVHPARRRVPESHSTVMSEPASQIVSKSGSGGVEVSTEPLYSQ